MGNDVEPVLDRIRRALVELDEEAFLSAVEEALQSGVSARRIVFEAMSKGMEEVGKLFEVGEYFLAEMIIAADMFKKAMSKLQPVLDKEAPSSGTVRGKVVIGTVEGDVHDIGKSLVASMLRAAGFEVVDLGVDVPAERFVEAVEKHRPHILAMSALLTTTMKNMEKVISLLEKRGLRDKVRVIIGGAPTTPEFAEKVGADAWARNAIEAVKKCIELSKSLDHATS